MICFFSKWINCGWHVKFCIGSWHSFLQMHSCTRRWFAPCWRRCLHLAALLPMRNLNLLTATMILGTWYLHSWKNMRIKPYVVKTKQMFHFPYGTIIYLSSFELMLFCRACRTMFGPPSTSFHHEQNKLHTCRWTQGHQSLIVPTTNLKQVSKNTWMSKHCARLQAIQSRSQPRTKWPF